MTREEFYSGKTTNGHIHPVIGRDRHFSRELDFGVWWRKQFVYPTYRITWVEATGELISVNLSKEDYEIIGVCKGEENIEKLLEGWADICMQPKSWYWIAEKFIDKYKGLYEENYQNSAA